MLERHDTFNIHKMIKEMAESYRLQTAGVIKDNLLNILLNTKNKLTKWK